VTTTSPLNNATNVAVATTITINLSEPIVAASVDADSIPVLANLTGIGQVQVAGVYSVNAAGTQIVFSPLAPLPGNTQIRVSVNNNSTIKDLAGNNLTFLQVLFTTAIAADTTPPQLVSVTPVNGSTGVGRSAVVTLTFSESLMPSTINGSNFELFNGTTPLNASVSRSIDNRTVTLSTTLPANTTITVVVSSEVTDLAGNPLPDFESEFTTGPDVDVTTASILSMRPASGSAAVPATSSITLFLSEPVDAATVPPALRVAQNGALVPGTITVTGGGVAINFTPTAPFAGGAVVQLFLRNARDTAGHVIPNFEGQFTTASDPLTSVPTVLRTSPSGSEAPRNPVVEIEFSEPLDPTTVTTDNALLLDQNFVPVSTTISVRNGNRVIRLVPTVLPLQAGQFYRIQVLGGLRDLQGQAVVAQFVGSFSTAPTTDDITPTVSLVTPPNGATNVGINALIRVRFSEPVNPLTVDATTIRVTSGAFVNVPASISFSANNAEVAITPLTALPDNSLLTIAITGVQDQAGHPVTPLTTTFTTRTGTDNDGPSVIASNVFTSQPNVPVNTVFTVEFDEPVDPQSVNDTSIVLRDNTTFLSVPAVVTLSANGRTVTLDPAADLAANRSHSFFVNFNTTVRDLAGNFGTSFSLSLTTSPTPDTTGPQVAATNPANTLTAVPTNAVVQIFFDEPIAPTSVGQVNLIVGGSALTVTRALSNSNRTLTLTPSRLLSANRLHTISVAGVRDTAGNLIAATVTTTFTTRSGIDGIRPAIASFTPAANTTNVPVSTQARVTFTEALNPLSVLNNNSVVVRVTNTGAIVPTTTSFSADFRTVILTPLMPLAPATQYTIAVVNTLTDIAGNAIASFGSANFTTQ
jgi:hypothetical protein